MTSSQPRRPKRADTERRLRQVARHARTLRVLQLIQSRGRWTAKSIAAELECVERTIYRDLEVLELAGVPWFFDAQERCYRVRPDFRFPTVNLTDDELLGQALATAVTDAVGLKIGPGARPTTRKLAASSDRAAELLAEAEQVLKVLELKLADHSRSQEAIRTVQWALLYRKQLAGTYESPYQSGPTKLTLHPYRLCLANRAWYLIARPANEKAAKTFRVARFKSLRMLDAESATPPTFDLQAHFGNAWSVYRGATTYEVAIQFTPDAAVLVTETTWHATQKVKRHQDGSVTLSFTVDGLEEIVWWVLGWSSRARVLRPEPLRQMVIERLQAALEMNQP